MNEERNNDISYMNSGNTIKKLINLRQLFLSLAPEQIAYLTIDADGWWYRQKNKKVLVRDIYFDLKKTGFINQKMIKKNLEVLTKVLEYYKSQLLISIVPTTKGFYFQVFNSKGLLLYAQSIYFYVTNWFQTMWLCKVFTELSLKKRKF